MIGGKGKAGTLISGLAEDSKYINQALRKTSDPNTTISGFQKKHCLSKVVEDSDMLVEPGIALLKLLGLSRADVMKVCSAIFVGSVNPYSCRRTCWKPWCKR